MEYKLEWLTKEEGSIIFYEEERMVPIGKFFVTGEEEAEFRIQDIVFLENQTKNDKIRKKVISEMTKHIIESFRLLWEEGFEETVLVEPQGTKIAEILNSTSVVCVAYSEYMMKKQVEQQKSTTCGSSMVKLTKDGDGYFCENEDKTFFCRLLPYETNPSETPGFYLYEVEVAKRKRNKGIATTCLTELFRLLSETTPVTVYLQAGSYNEPAVHLYSKLGFEISEELRYYALSE